MLERRSALATAKPYTSSVVQMGEVRGFALCQAIGSAKAISAVTGKLPTKVGAAHHHDGRTLMRIGANRFWIIGPENDDIGGKLGGAAVMTSLSHSRTRIFLDGVPARDVLAKGIPLDFHPTAFKPGMFALTGLHHTPVLVHCVSGNRFEIYALRTFAMSLWDWLRDAALEFGEGEQ
jgi:methylglutamate dehydrogenase subunit D